MKKFIAIICLTAMLTGCGSVEKSSSSEQEKSSEAASEEMTTEEPSAEIIGMGEAYRYTLEQLRSEGAESFSLCDLTGGIGPEVLAVRVKDGDINRIKLYQYQQDTGESKLLGTFDNYISYAAGSKLIIYGRYDNDTEVETTDFMHISEDGELVSDGDLRRTYKETEDGASGQFWKGEDTVTENEYNSVMSKNSAGPLRDVGNDFKLEDDIIDMVLGESGTWQKAYSTYLNECLPDVDDADNAGFSVLDINGDDVPELFYAPGYYHISPVKVLTIKDGGLRCLGGFGSYGSVAYSPDTNELLSSNTGMGYTSGAYFTLDSNGTFKQVMSFSDNAGAVYPESGEVLRYEINGQAVDENTYKDTIDIHSDKSFYSLGSDDSLKEENIKALAEGKYSAPVLQDKIVPVGDNTPEISDKYKSILSKFYYSCQLDLTDMEITGSENISDNTFSVYDIDCDGRDELIINVTSTFMAEMVTVIYGEDASGEVKVELVTAPNLTVYSNGIIEAGVMHNQGLAGRFWPYTVFTYNGDKDEYESYMYVDAWDKTVSPDQFPSEIDTSGTGIVYYITSSEADQGSASGSAPVDVTDYEKWHKDLLAGAEPVNIPEWNITEENIGL